MVHCPVCLSKYSNDDGRAVPNLRLISINIAEKHFMIAAKPLLF